MADSYFLLVTSKRVTQFLIIWYSSWELFKVHTMSIISHIWAYEIMLLSMFDQNNFHFSTHDLTLMIWHERQRPIFTPSRNERAFLIILFPPPPHTLLKWRIVLLLSAVPSCRSHHCKQRWMKDLAIVFCQMLFPMQPRLNILTSRLRDCTNDHQAAAAQS